MKRLVKISMLAGALAYFGGHLAYGNAKPVVGGVPYLPLFEAKTAQGEKDGILRVIWDYNPSKTTTLGYGGSALWLIDPNGTVVATGNPTIPSTVGASFVGFPIDRSNLFISAQCWNPDFRGELWSVFRRVYIKYLFRGRQAHREMGKYQFFNSKRSLGAE